MPCARWTRRTCPRWTGRSRSSWTAPRPVCGRRWTPPGRADRSRTPCGSCEVSPPGSPTCTAAGWVHGDLKPANVLLGAEGAVWLADFGLATELEGTHAYLPPLGTLDHVPPEWWSQRTGAGGTVVRPTADIWAFGVLAHQVLTGGLHPFPGATARARSFAAQAYARGSAPLRLDAGLEDDWRRLHRGLSGTRPRGPPAPHRRQSLGPDRAPGRPPWPTPVAAGRRRGARRGVGRRDRRDRAARG